MEKVLIVYYSNTGSNRFLANKIASDLNAQKAEIQPYGSVFALQLILSQMQFSLGMKKLNHDPANYDKIILVGPIWTGRLIAPLKTFLKRYKMHLRQLYFLTCCGSKDEDKDGKWGYTQVFDKVKEIIGTKCANCTALPITLVVPEDKLDDDQYILNKRLSNENFTGEILDRYNSFIDYLKIAEQNSV